VGERRGCGVRPYSALATLFWVWCTGAAQAGQPPSPGAAAILACRTLTNDAQQLACFRQASERLAEEHARPDQAAEAKLSVAMTPQPRPFGAPRPRPAPAARAKEADSLSVKVLSFADRGDGRVLFRFDDGSTWVETQTDEPVAGSLRVGQSVTLRRGLFGGYILDIPGRSFVRVARVGGA